MTPSTVYFQIVDPHGWTIHPYCAAWGIHPEKDSPLEYGNYTTGVCAPQSRQSAKLFLQSSDWDSPNPSPAGECTPIPRFWGEGHTRWRERGWGSLDSDGGTYTVVLFICIYVRTLWCALTHRLEMVHSRCPPPFTLTVKKRLVASRTATKIPFMYSFSGNSAASAPISTFMYL